MTKELREKYRQSVEKVWKDRKMQDFCMKKADIVYAVRDKVAEIDKPSIKTSFCFGYGYCGVSDEEDYRGAADMAEHARTHENYFISENMKQIESWIEELKDDSMVAYMTESYNPNSGLVCLNFCQPWSVETKKRHAEARGGLFIELSKAERKDVLKAYEIEKERFQKRLNIYLKRYGLSKVDSWTYLCD